MQGALTCIEALAMREVRVACPSGSPKKVASAMTVL